MEKKAAVSEAENLYKKGKKQEAFILLEEEIKKGNRIAYSKYSKLKRDHAFNELNGVTKILQQALRKKKDVSIYNELGLIYQRMFLFDKSVKILQEGLKHFPQAASLYNVLAHTYWKNGKISEAIISLEQGILQAKNTKSLSSLKTKIESERNRIFSNTRIQKLISDGKPEEAFKILESLVTDKIHNFNETIILLKNRWNTIKQNRMLETESAESLRTQETKILMNILELIKQI